MDKKIDPTPFIGDFFIPEGYDAKAIENEEEGILVSYGQNKA